MKNVIILTPFSFSQNTVRIATPVLGAALVTTLLFLLMTLLIKSDEVALSPESLKLTEFVRIPEVRDVQVKRPIVSEPEQPVTPPVAPELAFEKSPSNYGTGHIPFEPDVMEVSPEGYGDGAYLPLVKVQPVYPRRALSRGIEGYTVVEFDVGSDGSVRNPRIVDYHPSAIFNTSSINAVLKFRYKPMIENGRPIEVTGVQNRFTFELTH